MTDQEHARAIAEQVRDYWDEGYGDWSFEKSIEEATELILAALSLTADTARAQAFEEARREAMNLRTPPDVDELGPMGARCFKYARHAAAERFTELAARARATSGDPHGE